MNTEMEPCTATLPPGIDPHERFTAAGALELLSQMYRPVSWRAAVWAHLQRLRVRGTDHDSDWQPLASAPSRTWVLVHCRHGVVAAKLEPGSGWYTNPGMYSVMPTVWQPLPAGPQEETT